GLVLCALHILTINGLFASEHHANPITAQEQQSALPAGDGIVSLGGKGAGAGGSGGGVGGTSGECTAAVGTGKAVGDGGYGGDWIGCLGRKVGGGGGGNTGVNGGGLGGGVGGAGGPVFPGGLLVFAHTRRDAEQCALWLAEGASLPLSETAEARERVVAQLGLASGEDFRVVGKPNGNVKGVKGLSFLVRRGVGVHHAGVPRALLAILEDKDRYIVLSWVEAGGWGGASG
ncbi:hypothetical protein T492DRAFT_1142366, partial [Pavlovales sp. CCMP2436]